MTGSTWQALACVLTPSALKTLLRKQPLYLQNFWQQFPQIEGRLYIEMFQQALKRFALLRSRGVTLQTIWETHMPQEGFIPMSADGKTLTNDRFGYFCQKSGRWQEWQVVSVEVMRLFWDRLLNRMSCGQKTELSGLCQILLRTLPGHIFVCCYHCGWSLPQSAMHDEKKCNYCVTSQKYPQRELRKHQGTWYIWKPRPLIVVKNHTKP